LKNVSKESLNLKGWEISGVLGEKSYTFTKSRNLGPGSTIMIRSGKGNRSSDISSKVGVDSTVSTKKYLWNAQYDVAVVSNPKGDIISQISDGTPPSEKMMNKIQPPIVNSRMRAPTAGAQNSASEDPSNCVLM